MTNSSRREVMSRGATFGRAISLGGVLLAGALVFSTGPALAAAPPVFDNIPATLPGNLPSWGFEAYQTSEFGDYIGLAAGERSPANLPVTVVMSSWGCESGGAIDNTDPPTNGYCTTTPGDTFSVPLTLNLYAVNTSGAVPVVGTLLLTTTKTAHIPYRPSFDATNCKPKFQYGAYYYGWWSPVDKKCYSGFAYEVTFDLPAGPNLPDQLIWSLQYNTTHYGPHPIGGTTGPYDSLNIALVAPSGTSAGTDFEPTSLFMNSASAGWYAAGDQRVGIFRDDVGNWADNAPALCIGTGCTPAAPATPSPIATPTPTTIPTEQVGGASSEPTQQVGGATGTPGITPPPTTTGGNSGNGSSQQIVIFLCVAFAAIGSTAVFVQRRAFRR